MHINYIKRKLMTCKMNKNYEYTHIYIYIYIYIYIINYSKMHTIPINETLVLTSTIG